MIEILNLMCSAGAVLLLVRLEHRLTALETQVEILMANAGLA